MNPKVIDDKYFLENYNTSIPKDKQEAFDKWVKAESKRQGRNILMDKGDYDIQGFWLSGDYKRTDKRGHGSDKWKKPNHPTFSNESIYHGKDNFYGGEWKEGSFKPSDTNLKLFGEERLKKYFKEVESGSELLLSKKSEESQKSETELISPKKENKNIDTSINTPMNINNMDPSLLALIAPTLLKTGVGFVQSQRGKQLGQAERPGYEIPKELYDVLENVQREAAQIELPGQSLLEQKLGGTTSRAISAMKESADSPAAILGNVAKLAEGERENLNDIAIAAAQGHKASQEKLRQYLTMMGKEKQAKWEWEEAKPFMERMSAAQRESEAGLQNIFGGATGLGGAIYEHDINKKLMDILGYYSGGTTTKNAGLNDASLNYLKMLARVKAGIPQTTSGAGGPVESGIYSGTPVNLFTKYDFDTSPYIID